MKKDTLIVFCSPDIHRLVARRSLGSIKSTNLQRAELHIFDNRFDEDFRHPIVMERTLRMAQRCGMNILFLDDDVEIYRYDWIDRLYEVSKDLDADIVSCIQSGDHGRINSAGEFLYSNGTTAAIYDFCHDKESVINKAVYAPVLCSAIMLIKNPHLYYMDSEFKKYKQDLDICMQAWDQGRKVGLALDMDLIHNRGFTGDQNPSYQSIFATDAAYFAHKWKDKLERIRNLPELVQYTDQIRKSWTQIYNYATNNLLINPEESKAIYQDVIERCYIPRWVAGAHYHLYRITGDILHLRECNRVNPCHGAARKKLSDLGEKPRNGCSFANDCRTCNMKRFGYVVNDIKDILDVAFRSV
jgi:hypothetical protein